MDRHRAFLEAGQTRSMTNIAGGPRLVLNNGVEIPQIGFGVFQIPADGAQQAVEAALAAGYRHIDTAAAYNNEEGVGAGIAASGVPRDEIFVTTKLRNGNQGTDSVKREYDGSRKKLGLDVIDLYLIHWPSPARDLYIDSWKTMESLYGDGQIRAIGVSNFLKPHLDRLIAETDIVPAVNQIEIHPTFQQRDVVAEIRSHGIIQEAYSPLGQATYLHEPAVASIAERLGVTAAQVVLRWHLQAGTILIPKSEKPARMAENIDILGFELGADDVAAIDALDVADAGGRIGGDPMTAEWTQIR
jgi:2,5-diketo-D-gluconate reductase A